GVDERLAEVRRTPRRLQGVDARDGHRLPTPRVERGRLAEAEDRPGAPVEGEDGELLGRAAVGDHLARRGPGPRPQVAAPEAPAGVDQDGCAPLRVLAQVPVGLLAEE